MLDNFNLLYFVADFLKMLLSFWQWLVIFHSHYRHTEPVVQVFQLFVLLYIGTGCLHVVT